MAVPPNLTPATATVITSLPYTTVLDVTDAPTNTDYPSTCDTSGYHAVWYRYTTLPGQTLISVSADVDDPLAPSWYVPTLSIWTGTPPALTEYGTVSTPYCTSAGVGGYWMQVVVEPVTTYFFQITDQNNNTPLGVNLKWSVVSPPAVTAPAGSIVINDDKDIWPAAVYGADGTLLQFVDLPSGESGATLPTGEVCLPASESATAAKIYDRHLSVMATVSVAPLYVKPIGVNRVTGRFYIAAQVSNGLSATTVYCVDKRGVTIATYGPIGDASNVVWSLTPSNDDTLLYFMYANDSAIKTWDLGSDSLGSDLVPTIAGEKARGFGDAFTLQDGSVVFGYTMTTGDGTPMHVRHYSSLGSLLHTYTINTHGADTLNHFSYLSETAFWAWTYYQNQSPAIFQQIQISDGSVLAFFETSLRQQSGLVTDANSTFGISSSCPSLSLPTAWEMLPTFPPGTPVDVPIRRLRRAPVLNSDGKWLFLKRFELDADVGHGAVTGQGQDPKVQLRISRDGGQTFGNIHTVSAGRLGQYRQRIRFLALGSGRNIVVEVVVSDPIAWAFYQAFADLAEGLS